VAAILIAGGLLEGIALGVVPAFKCWRAPARRLRDPIAAAKHRATTNCCSQSLPRFNRVIWNLTGRGRREPPSLARRNGLENTDMARMAADPFGDIPVATGGKHDYGIVRDSLNGAGDATRRHGKIKWLHVWHEEVAAFAAAALVAFAAGLLAAGGARAADEPTQLRPPTERAGTNSVHGEPTDRQFAPPNRPDVTVGDAHIVGALYRPIIGPQLANSSDPRSGTRPSGSVER
jgi:hypothetical protein